MRIINGFLSLVIRNKENLSDDEKNYIGQVYSELGKDGVYNFVKRKKIIPFVARTLASLGYDIEYWN